MPLLKLWNSIRGRSTKGQSVDQGPAAEPQSTTKAKKSNRRGSGLGIFGGGPHAGLCKRLKSVDASSVLEISVEDGSRALAVLETIEKSNKSVRYVAIDQFEMAGGPVSLKQFHQTLRSKGFRPQLFPETIERGLIRVAHTLGAVDLVLIAAPPEIWQTPQVLPLLSRVTHPSSLVLYRDEEQTWKKYPTSATQRRAA
jgi:hypothetical protein